MYFLNRIVAFLSVSVVCVLILLGCDGAQSGTSHPVVSSFSVQQGKTLAASYCQSCHTLPDPALLDVKSWTKGVLPIMGPRLGIFRHGSQAYPYTKYDPSLSKNFYPEKPVLTPEQWQHIIDYYTASAPEVLPQQQRSHAIQTTLPLFDVQTPALPYKSAMTSFVKVDTAHAATPLIISDAGRKKTYFLNKALQAVDSVLTKGPIVDMQLFQNAMLACNIGVLNPNNGRYGKASYFHKDAKGHWKEDTSNLFETLARPVQITPADLNKDGKTDYVVCEFGFLTGSLCWMENKGDKTFERHVLRPLPGAVKAYLQDYNNDGLMDIWVLFAQGEEGVFLYTNQGSGRFDEKQVLRFPPMYGSSYFEMTDLNKDGFLDIVYTCGDNADYSPVLKPYHGVYLFLNNGNYSFTQTYFFPIHGCYKAIARDFDKDGDMDLATISYFADYAQQPEEGFVYLENKGSFDFQPYTLKATEVGRWLTMDAGDIDGDGWTDLVLGNFCLGPSLSVSKYDWRQAAPFIVLKNTGSRSH